MRNKDEKYQKETINLINLNHQVALVIFCSQNFTNESKTCLRRGSLTYDGTEFLAHIGLWLICGFSIGLMYKNGKNVFSI